jgi:hypothetical protein
MHFRKQLCVPRESKYYYNQNNSDQDCGGCKTKFLGCHADSFPGSARHLSTPAETLIKMAAGRCTFVINHASKPEMRKSACWQIGNYNSADSASISGSKPQY